MPPRPLVAVVEDDPGLLADLVEFLDLRHFAAHGFASAEAFFATWPSMHFDLLLLDVALPGASGLDVVRHVRAQTMDAMGVVMLTALDANDDQVLGLNAGADLYLSKRSSLEVIEAACRSVLRRLGHPGVDDAAAHEPWRLRLREWQLHAPNGRMLALTHTEVVLLSALVQAQGQVVSREALLVRLGKQETLASLRNLDNTASRLRRKGQAACGVDLPIRPSYGKGYIFTGRCEVSS